MKKYNVLFKALNSVLVISFLSTPISVNANYEPKPCANVSDYDKKKACLNKLAAKEEKKLERINNRNKRIDRALKVGCGADKVAGPVAGKVVKGGSYAYKAGRYAGDKITGQKPCK